MPNIVCRPDLDQTTPVCEAVGELVTRVIPLCRDDVTLFGGTGADGALVVCAVEVRHSGG